ncbi:hypothetical protein ABTX34_20335 [Streptomyces sp. NPDC096538]
MNFAETFDPVRIGRLRVGRLTGLRGTGGFSYRYGETKAPYTFAYEVTRA